ncbi:MAG: UvrD-helicase domain-containing protein [Aquihabitans sp.]
MAEQDIRASDLLIVTFTRAATTELRDRVRNRFAEAARHLSAPVAEPCGDPLLDHLAGLPNRAVARERLEQAVTEFDAATVSTIHGFATQVLGAIGSTSAIDPDAPLVDDTVELTAQLCADVMASASVLGTDPDHLPKYSALQTAVMTVLERPGLILLPEPGPGVTTEMEVLRDLVDRAVAAVRSHRHRIGTRSFTDILEVLRDALDTAEGAAAVIEALQSRYRVALIDEFQDTDPVQWDIFRSLFGASAQDADTPTAATPTARPASAFVLVGDPKQAIYAFRGADINTYLEAVRNHAEVQSLDTNWRSDGAVLTAVATILDGASFGDDDIRFVPVGPAPKHADRRLGHSDGSPRPGLVVRLACDESISRTTRKEPAAPEVRSVIWNDLAHQVSDLLIDGLIPTASPDGVPGTRPVVPSDVAVLVRSRKDGEFIRDVLTSRGIPAVVARGGSVLESEAADHWRWLLEGLARPSDPVRARTFALSWFSGHDAAWVDAATDEDVAELQDDLHRWSEALTSRGIDDLVRRVFRESGVVARVLAQPDGDRSVTDLDHLAELLRTQTGRSRPGVAALLAVLNVDPESDPNAEFEGDLASRRVASEADSVQIMTVWVAKGLEFPITCVPTMWTGPRSSPIVFHDPVTGRAYDLAGGKGWPDRAGAKERLDRYERERAGEELRLLYVALTRARHQTIVWWSPVSGSNKSPLARVLFARDDDGNLDPELFEAATVKRCPDDALLDRLAPLVERSEGTLEVSLVPPAHALTGTWDGADTGISDVPLSVAELSAVPPRVTRRWSFTGISAGAVDAAYANRSMGGGPTETATAPELEERDEPFEVSEDQLSEADLAGAAAGEATAIAGTDHETESVSLGYSHPTVSPLAPLPAGAAFGTLVHSIYEHVDFAAAAVDDRLCAEF